MRTFLKQVNVYILLFCSWIIFFIGFSLIGIGLFAWFVNNNTLTEVAGIFAGAATALSVGYLAEQIRVSLQQEKITRSYDYIKRYNDPAFREILAQVGKFFRNEQITESEKLEILFYNKETDGYKDIRSSVAMHWNFFEDMAIFYNRNLLDKELITSFFKSISMDIFDKSRWYIEKMKIETQRDSFCEERKTMNDKLKKEPVKGEK
jgi:hypothetical protein